ncbi:SGNH/GDSL hydrolase family protein [Pseudomonas azotoformans]
MNRRWFLTLSALVAAYPAYRVLGSLSDQRRFHVNGGQLARLRAALADPRQSFVGITFIGDSITWGTGTLQGPNPNPRNGTLTDPRDNFVSESYVNNVKRYVGAKFMAGAQVSVSNWRSSPAGQSIVEFSSGRSEGGPQKKVRISNQGINGASTSSYKARNLVSSGDGANYAVLPDDGFVFIQLGTNDRGLSPTNPNTPKGLTDNLVAMVSEIKTKSEVILMCANPSTVEPPSVYRFGMAAVRSAILDAAKICEVDCIDNYAAFDELDLATHLVDGLHPNVAGHLVTAQNIITAIEQA